MGARLLFDAAHAYGATRDGVKVGGLGDAEVFSLSGTKPVTTAEGGLIATRDAQLLRRIELLRGYGFSGDYNSKLVGLNGKMSELHAALGLLTLRRIEDALAARAAHVAHYMQILADVSGLSYQRVRLEDRSTCKDFAIAFANSSLRDQVETALTAAGVQTKRYFKPCHRMDAFAHLHTRPLPATEVAHERILCIPLFESMTSTDVELIGGTIRKAVSTEL